MSKPLARNEAWVFVGSTGTGKSRHLKLFAGQKDEVTVSADAQSCTKQPALYQHRADRSVFLLDTVGFEDSSGQSGKHIMVQTFRMLCERKVMDVKVIWFVKAEGKASDTLQAQAKFINSLLGGRIWRSTFVVVKQGRFEDDAQGALASSLSHGRGDREGSALPVLMHTCVDWMQNPRDRKVVLEDMADMSETRRLRRGLLHEAEVLERFRKQLAQTPVARVITKIELCRKCGQVGDRRCMPAKCHVNRLRVHASRELVHPSKVALRHSGFLQWVHTERVNSHRRHRCRTRYWHGRVRDPVVSVLSKGLLRFMVLYCDDCGRPMDEEGCHSGPGCGAFGCETYYEFSCCSRSPDAQGCRQQFNCCDGPPDSDGCQPYQLCCGKRPGTTGCAHACCGRPIGSEGGLLVCSKCGRKWGDRHAPGCTEAERHDTVRWV